MAEIAHLRSTRPWVRPRTVVFADDTIGTDLQGEPAKFDHDVVVIAIAPSAEGGVVVTLRPYTDRPGHR